MATVGYNDLKQYALPSYWDAAELRKWQLIDGTTYDQFVADIGRALAIQNGQILSDPLIASLVSTTTEMATEYQVGVSNGMQKHTEYARPEQRRGATTGHMLPLEAYDRGLGWTWDMLRKARRIQLDADIASAMADVRNQWEKDILTRLFKSTYTAVGSSGRSMPLADGGTADAAYIPIAVPARGGTFLYTHDHISNLNGITQANIETAVANLWEHGYDAPFDIVAAYADLSSWTNTTNVTGFVPKANGLIRYGNTADLAQVDETYVGVIETDYGPIRLRVTGRIPTTYWAIYKSYGANDQRNPLVIRLSDYGVGAVLLKGDHIREYPLEEAILFSEFGVGVANRVGACAYINSAGGYTDPTIS
ncbi:MAG: hypothetical protein WC683_08045 [bacterium]